MIFAVIDDIILRVLCRHGAGMIGKDSEAGSDRNILRLDFFTASGSNNAVFLIGGHDNPIFNGISLNIAHYTIPLIHRLGRSSSVAGQSHPTSVTNNPAFFFLMANDFDQQGQSNIFDFANTESGHHEVLQTVDTATDFCDTGPIFAEGGGRCGTGTDNTDRVTGFS